MSDDLGIKNSKGAPYRLDPDSVLPLTVLLQSRGVRSAELARACGYANVSKGVRRIEALSDGDLHDFESLKLLLAKGLDLDIADLETAAADTRYIKWAREDRAYRRGFEPHVIWKTALTIPRPIAIAGVIGASRMLKFIPATGHALKISAEALANCPDGVPCYGRVTGFYVNYSPDRAVEFNREGEPLSVLDAAVRPGHAITRVNGRPFTLADKLKE
jgi:hypothetical protein